MNSFRITHDWLATGKDVPEHVHTSAMLALHVGDVNLTRNEEIWSRTVRDAALLSAYPLAMWFASSWWRLNFEPLSGKQRPPLSWRMAHELGAANHGFVWPQVVFASDTEVMQVWAVPSSSSSRQSVKYLSGLDTPASVSLEDFQRGVDQFIASVLNRLDAMGSQGTDLAKLWAIINEDRADPQGIKYRRLEAAMGYDPDDCPESVMEKALQLEAEVGVSTLSELVPIYGNSSSVVPLAALDEMANAPGLIGVPAAAILEGSVLMAPGGPPWQRAIKAAAQLRTDLSQHDTDLLESQRLYEMLGLTVSDMERWSPVSRSQASVAVPEKDKKTFKFVPRKKHPIAKRFEMARFLGDYLWSSQTGARWLASTDLATSRQKFQRAFAAEFLCPIEGLKEFLDDDYSESAIEDAAQHFQVSATTVSSLLANHGVVLSSAATDFSRARIPYSLGV